MEEGSGLGIGFRKLLPWPILSILLRAAFIGKNTYAGKSGPSQALHACADTPDLCGNAYLR
jgi:hypothetical protein